MRALRCITAAAWLVLATAAHADYEKGVEAAKRGDAATAFAETKSAADQGDVRAYAPLAKLYLQGVGTRQDLRASQAWASKAAAKDNAEGQFVYYAATVSLPELEFLDKSGNVDAQKYRALAARPVTAREDEMTAYDMLGKAASQGHRDAALALAGFYADNIGEGNRPKAEELLDKVPQRPPLFDSLRKDLSGLDALGSTLVTLRLVGEVVPAASATAQSSAAEKDSSKKDCKTINPLRAVRSGPIEKVEWLPLAAPEMRQAYLMRGTWKERWTFDVCGAETAVLITFSADGLGSASFTTNK